MFERRIGAPETTHPRFARNATLHRRRGAAVSLLLTTGLLISACSGSTPESSQTAETTAATQGPLSSELPESIRKAGQVVVLSDIPSPPFEMFVSSDSKEVTGFDYDIAQALGAQLGVKFVFKQTPFSGIIPALQAGQGDVIISQMSVKPERMKVLDFVKYFSDGTGILVMKGNPDNIKTLDDLCGKQVATQSGASQVDILNEQSTVCKKAGKSAVDVSTFPSIPNAQLALSSGKAVALVQDTAAMAYAASTVDGGNTYELVDVPGSPAGYAAAPGGIGVLKDNDELAAAVQKALQAIIDDGTYTKIAAKYSLESIAVSKAEIGSEG